MRCWCSAHLVCSVVVTCYLNPPEQEDEEGSEEREDGESLWRSGGRDSVGVRLSPEAGKIPIPAGLGPAGAVLRDDPRLVLGGGAQVGEELLASPVISSFFAGTDAVTPDTGSINLYFIGGHRCKTF